MNNLSPSTYYEPVTVLATGIAVNKIDKNVSLLEVYILKRIGDGKGRHMGKYIVC